MCILCFLCGLLVSSGYFIETAETSACGQEQEIRWLRHSRCPPAQGRARERGKGGFFTKDERSFFLALLLLGWEEEGRQEGEEGRRGMEREGECRRRREAELREK